MKFQPACGSLTIQAIGLTVCLDDGSHFVDLNNRSDSLRWSADGIRVLIKLWSYLEIRPVISSILLSDLHNVNNAFNRSRLKVPNQSQTCLIELLATNLNASSIKNKKIVKLIYHNARTIGLFRYQSAVSTTRFCQSSIDYWFRLIGFVHFITQRIPFKPTILILMQIKRQTIESFQFVDLSIQALSTVNLAEICHSPHWSEFQPTLMYE